MLARNHEPDRNWCPYSAKIFTLSEIRNILGFKQRFYECNFTRVGCTQDLLKFFLVHGARRLGDQCDPAISALSEAFLILCFALRTIDLVYGLTGNIPFSIFRTHVSIPRLRPSQRKAELARNSHTLAAKGCILSPMQTLLVLSVYHCRPTSFFALVAPPAASGTRNR